MLAVNAHLMLAVIPILYIGSAKVQQNSNFTKRKSDFFSSPLTLFLLYSRQQSSNLFLRNESLPGLIIVEDADLGNLTLRFVHIFNRCIGDIFRCPFYTVCLRMVKERWRSRGVGTLAASEIQGRLHHAASATYAPMASAHACCRSACTSHTYSVSIHIERILVRSVSTSGGSPAWAPSTLLIYIGGVP